jgi:Protein kinase domain/Lanthionine synthetase C-like protein
MGALRVNGFQRRGFPMEALRYAPFCIADRTFYDSLEHLQDHASRFAAFRRPAPAGWQRLEQGIWVLLRPSQLCLPDQGWKIHISSCPDDAEPILTAVWSYCVANAVPFKFLRSRELMVHLNGKYADRVSSGKLVTVYPVDESQLAGAVDALAGALEGRRGPYILSDLRCGDGPVYVRYGPFRPCFCASASGDLVPAIRAPDGRLVPDVRRPVFQTPSWLQPPAFLERHLARRNEASGGDFPYRIERPLHFSNGGGVYLARDARSGRQVVLKEARPLSGWDFDGSDAFTRLAHERAFLELLSDIDVVPALVDDFRFWEHRFLVEEHIEGSPLNELIAARYPLTHPDPTAREIAEYTTFALDVHARVERAVTVLHERGVVFGDLHLRNIIVRPDGRVALVDLEEAFRSGATPRQRRGAAGFAAPATFSGAEVDRYALACVGLSFFFPLTILQHHDPASLATLIKLTRNRFPVPEQFCAGLARDLRVDVDGGTALRAATAATPDPLAANEPDWGPMRGRIIEALLATATPERADRLFPGDVDQFRYGGFGLAYGAAGVLYALAQAGADVDERHIDWLVSTTRHAEHPHLGFYNGLHGVAYVLERLGRPESALEVLARVPRLGTDLSTISLFGGLAGVGLNLLHLASRTGFDHLRDRAATVAEKLALELDGDRNRGAPPGQPVPSRASVGLLHGYSGAALFLLRFYEQTGDRAFLDRAATALRYDVAHCHTTADATVQVHDGVRLLPYLAAGSAGIGLVIDQFLRHRPDDDLRAAARGIRRACRAEFVVHAGLFNGRAGLMAYLSGQNRWRADPEMTAALAMHRRCLAWHAVACRGGIGFPGDQLLRLSMDLATGSAGILLALLTADGVTEAALPFLETRPPISVAAE